MMTIFSILLVFSSLVYTPQIWSFTGLVTETREIELMGFPAQVARVQSKDFEAWVIQRMDEGQFEVVLGTAKPGDLVRVSISGPHVSKTSVNWKECQPADSNYCRLGALYDDGLLALDWNVPLSPSNEFIHLGHPNPSWHQALFWNTEKLSPADDHGYRFPTLPRPGCRALRGGIHRPCHRMPAWAAVIE